MGGMGATVGPSCSVPVQSATGAPCTTSIVREVTMDKLLMFVLAVAMSAPELLFAAKYLCN